MINIAKRNKYHWYPDKNKPNKQGYSKTACKRDGSKVGGLITSFFGMDINDIKNCKICVKKFKEKNNAK